MRLAPCVQCQRHVRVDAWCPFCARSGVSSIARALAGAVLATSCAAKQPPALETPPQPPPSQSAAPEPIAPTPGGSASAAPARSIVSRIEGVVHMDTGRPLADLPVDLMDGTTKVAWTVTDLKGGFKFADVRGGHYIVIVRPFLNTSAKTAERTVTVSDTAPVQLDISVAERRTPGNTVAPYGAPALRRRVV